MNMIRGYQIPTQEHVGLYQLLEAPVRISVEGRRISIDGIIGLVQGTVIASTKNRWVGADSEEITPNWRP